MLVVKVEVWPHGDERSAREIGRATIVNFGGDEAIADLRIPRATRKP